MNSWFLPPLHLATIHAICLALDQSYDKVSTWLRGINWKQYKLFIHLQTSVWFLLFPPPLRLGAKLMTTYVEMGLSVRIICHVQWCSAEVRGGTRLIFTCLAWQKSTAFSQSNVLSHEYRAEGGGRGAKPFWVWNAFAIWGLFGDSQKLSGVFFWGQRSQ